MSAAIRTSSATATPPDSLTRCQRNANSLRLIVPRTSRPQSYAHYQHADLSQQAAVLAHGIAEGQPFLDGNKRLALIAMLTFLELNGHRIDASDPELAHREARAHVAGEVEGRDAGAQREGREGVPQVVDPPERLDPDRELRRPPVAVAEVVQIEVTAGRRREDKRRASRRGQLVECGERVRLQRHGSPPVRVERWSCADRTPYNRAGYLYPIDLVLERASSSR